MRHPREALYELICELFDTGSLLRFVTLGAEGERIRRGLPTEQVAMAQMVAAVIASLYRHKVLEDFLTRLRREFPRRAQEIGDVHAIVRTGEREQARQGEAKKVGALLSEVTVGPWVFGVIVVATTPDEVQGLVALLTEVITWNVSVQS